MRTNIRFGTVGWSYKQSVKIVPKNTETARLSDKANAKQMQNSPMRRWKMTILEKNVFVGRNSDYHLVASADAFQLVWLQKFGSNKILTGGSIEYTYDSARSWRS